MARGGDARSVTDSIANAIAIKYVVRYGCHNE